MKWYEFIALVIAASLILYVVFGPWLSIMDIHRSIDRLTDKLDEILKENKKYHES